MISILSWTCVGVIIQNINVANALQGVDKKSRLEAGTRIWEAP